jgi:hypothetical protein
VSPRGKPPEKKTRYDLALEHVAHHFEKGTLPLAPPRGEQPADLEQRREGTESREKCAVCPWPVSGELPLPGQRPRLVEYVYKDRTVSFHGDCEAAWLSASREWREQHP